MILVGSYLKPRCKIENPSCFYEKGKKIQKWTWYTVGKNEIASLKIQAVVWVMNVVTGTTREPFR